MRAGDRRLQLFTLLLHCAPCVPCCPCCCSGVLMDKIDVNGRHASPVFNHLKAATGNTAPIPFK